MTCFSRKLFVNGLLVAVCAGIVVVAIETRRAIFIDRDDRLQPFSAESVIHSMYPELSFADTLQAVGELRPEATIKQANGVASYVRGRASGWHGLTSDAVAFFGVATAEVSSSAAWGMNTAVSDSEIRVPGSSKGRFITGTENDLYVQNPDTGVEGFLAAGNSLSQPKFGAGFVVGTLSQPTYYRADTAFGSAQLLNIEPFASVFVGQYVSGKGIPKDTNIVSTDARNKSAVMSKPAAISAIAAPLNSLIRWPYGFLSQSGAAVNGLYLGALDQTGSNSYSQFALWEIIDTNGLKQNVRLQASPKGELHLTNTLDSQVLAIGGPPLSSQYLSFMKHGLRRVAWYTDGTHESGDSAGSDLFLGLYNDAGDWVKNSVKVARKTGEWTFLQIPTFISGIKLEPTATSDLPQCSGKNEGLRLAVTDAQAPEFLKPLMGGGDIHAPAYCNGTRWVAG